MIQKTESNQGTPAAQASAPARPQESVTARRVTGGEPERTERPADTTSASSEGAEESRAGTLLEALAPPPKADGAPKADAPKAPADPKIQALQSQIASLETAVSALEKRKGSLSWAAFSTAMDQARQVADMLGCALAGKPYNPDDFVKRFRDLIGSWRQTSEGNCVSVATIKAAMHKWGNKVFLDQKPAADGGVDLTLRDGHRMHLSPQELGIARQLSRFRGRDPQAVEYANLCYAAIAKRALQNGHEGARTFARACHSLNNGEQVGYPAKLLGIGAHVRRINVRDIPRHEIVMAWNSGHMIYGTNGATDRWGRPTSPWSWGLTGAYVLV